MKYFILPFISLLFFISNAQQPFVTTWEVTAGDLDITIPTNTDDYTYDYSIDFGDGTVLTNQTGDVTHFYSTPGVYTVSISGVFPHFYGKKIFTFTEDSDKLISIEQWGDNQWLSMKGAFYFCLELVLNASDTPNLSQVTDLSQMFF